MQELVQDWSNAGRMTVHSSFEDVSELSATLGSAFDIEVLQLTRGRFEGELTTWPLSGVLVSHGSLKRSVQISGASHRRVTMLLSGPASPGRLVLNGTTLERRDILATPHLTEHRFVLPEGFQGIVLQLDHDVLGKSLFPKKQFLSGAENLWSFAHFVVQMGDSLSPNAREALGERCLEILLSELPSSAIDRRESLSCRRKAALLAADLIHHRPQASLAMKTLCAHTHVSERTLREGFVDVFGLPPMEYLLALRLNLVRARLRSGGPGVTVAQIATEQGFWHLSRFAGQYRRFFGECPSQTRVSKAENG